jgi:rRNA maturation endonuclease Nob1
MSTYLSRDGGMSW